MKIKSLFASIFAPLVLLAAGCAWADAPFTVSTDGQEVTDGKTGLAGHGIILRHEIY